MPAAQWRSLYVHHLHMGGWNGDALEWEALSSPRFLPRLRKLGIAPVGSAAEADLLIVTGLLTERNLNWVLAQIAHMPQPSLVIAAGDAAIDGGVWAANGLPGLAPYPLRHYVEIGLAVPGNPVTPQALLAALAAAPRPSQSRLAVDQTPPRPTEAPHTSEETSDEAGRET